MRIVTLSQLSLAGSSGIAEAKIPLWWADGTTVSTTLTSSGTPFLYDGGSIGTSPSASQAKLFTFSSNWSATLQVALEATMYASTSSYTAVARIWDFTAGGTVGSSVATSSTTATVLRSGQFTLIPGRTYGVSVYLSSSGGTAYICDASLIIFP